ncbi:hypothetical protein Tco_0545419 [Tanacetum coccineum]
MIPKLLLSSTRGIIELCNEDRTILCLMTDTPSMEVIKNVIKWINRTVKETKQECEPTTAEEKQDRRGEMKARGTLLMALPNKDQLKFHSNKDAKLLMESQENTNSNNNISTNEADNTAYGVSAAHTQSNPTTGDNLNDDVICAFLASQPNSPQMSRKDLEQIDLDDLEKMDLQWEIAILTIRARRFIKRTGRQLDINGQRVGFDRSKVEFYMIHLGECVGESERYQGGVIGVSQFI